MKKFLIAGNWKMNKSIDEAKEFIDELIKTNPENAEDIAILAPYTQLPAIAEAVKGSGIKFGAQNVHFMENGAYTGEISAPMLKELGVDYCVVGHSERRQYFQESDTEINRKLAALIDNDITPILCVGEALNIRQAGADKTFVAGQLFADFAGLPPEAIKKVVIAYEPIWAIGTGKTATAEQAEEMCAFIRGILSGIFSIDISEDFANSIADEMVILYGGSMKAENAKEILSKPDVNGGLIGGASLKLDEFTAIAGSANELSK